MLIVEPLSRAELVVLRAYVEADETMIQRVNEQGGQTKLKWHATTDALVERGALLRSKRGILVTPEGAAALLDVVPIDVMRTASPTEETGPEDAPSVPSTGPHTSAARSSRRSRGAS